MEKQALTTTEIAGYCRVCLPTVHNWIKDGRLSAYRHPGYGQYRVIVGDFLKFLKKNGRSVPEGLEEATYEHSG